MDKIDKKMHCPRPPYWGKSSPKEVNTNEQIMIMRGGGFSCILNFIIGKTKGYNLESGGLGLQVATMQLNRESFYANRNSFGFCDQPAILTATIPAKYLDEANNSYEAGLRPQYRYFLQNIKLEKLNSDLINNMGNRSIGATQILRKCKTKIDGLDS